MPKQQENSPPEVEAPLLSLPQAVLLFVLGLVGGVASLPYSLSLQGERLGLYLQQSGQTLRSLYLSGVVQNAAIVAVAVLVGLRLSRRVGLVAPLSLALGQRDGQGVAKALAKLGLPLSLSLGVGVALVTVALDRLWFFPASKLLREKTAALLERTPAWKESLLVVHGAFTEELIFRLLLVSLLCFVLCKLRRVDLERGRVPSEVALAAVLSGAVFTGFLHLPALSTFLSGAPVPSLLVVRTVLQHGLLGLCAGALFYTRGLEAAMVAHLGADLVLHGILPTLQRAGFFL